MDHGPEGVRSTLAQGHKVQGQRELQYRPIIYHSRALTKAERGYGKIEGESLAVLAGFKVNSMYLYGTHFEVVNNLAPLIPLYNNRTRTAPMRLERHRSKLNSFCFLMTHQPGKNNPADYGSKRPPPPKTYTDQEKEELGVEDKDDNAKIEVGRVLEELDQVGRMIEGVRRVDTDPAIEAITVQEVKDATNRDQRLLKLMEVVQTGLERKEMPNSPYRKVLDKLSYQRGVLLRGTRVMIPFELEGRAVALAHEGHKGIKATLHNLRDKV